MYLGLLLSGLSLIVGFFKNFGIVIVFSIAEGGQSSQHAPIFCWSEMVTVFWLTLFNTEDKRRNGDSLLSY